MPGAPGLAEARGVVHGRGLGKGVRCSSMSTLLESFGFQSSPFRLPPDERFLFLTESHRQALAYLECTALSSDGFMVLTGEVGVGKSLLLQRLAREVGDSQRVVYINQTSLPAVELLKILLYELTGTYVASGEAELLIRIREALRETLDQGQRTLLLVDEAQNLGFEAVEQLRQLSDVQHDGNNLLNIVLAGQAQLASRIEEGEFDLLRQRVRMRFHLRPLAREEVGPYIRFRMWRALGIDQWSVFRGPWLGSRGAAAVLPQIDEAALEGVCRHTLGVPRLVNMLCEAALVQAASRGQGVISADDIERAVDELGWHEQDGRPTAVMTMTSGLPLLEPLLTVEAIDREGRKRVETFFRLPVTIGRTGDNDLVLDDSTVSKRHARVVRDNGTYYLEDLGSTNGTRVNGRRVRRCLLRGGEAIRFGKYRARMTLGGED